MVSMIFSYPEVEGQIEEILANWLRSYEVFDTALDIYFTTMSIHPSTLKWNSSSGCRV